MKKDRTKCVKNWSELIEYVESVNNHEKAIVLTGWNIKIVNKDKTEISDLKFATKPIDILLTKKACDEQYVTKKKVSTILDKTYYSIPGEERGYYERFFYKLKYLLKLE